MSLWYFLTHSLTIDAEDGSEKCAKVNQKPMQIYIQCLLESPPSPAILPYHELHSDLSTFQRHLTDASRRVVAAFAVAQIFTYV